MEKREALLDEREAVLLKYSPALCRSFHLTIHQHQLTALTYF